MKKIVNKHFNLEDRIYHSSTEVIVGDWDYFSKFLKDRGITQDVPDKNWFAETGTLFDNEGLLSAYYIRLPYIDFSIDNYCVIVHELSHLTFNVLDNAGVEFSGHNQEPYSYLLDMFLNEFLTKAKKLK